MSAAELIEDKGWIQQAPVSPLGYCVTGAIDQASHGLARRGDIVSDARSKLWYVINNNSITAWNDTPGRTKEEVLAKLREAAKS